MESNRSTTAERQTAEGKNEETSERILMSGKPLHRFLQRDPRSFGIVLVIFGCAELLIGFQVAYDPVTTSFSHYVDSCQGALVLISGILSIYTDIRPTKKMVIACLAIYVVSILGLLISIYNSVYFFIVFTFFWHGSNFFYEIEDSDRKAQLVGVKVVSLIYIFCMTGLLIFLSTIARFGLKSTNTQVIVHCIPHQAASETTAE